MAQLTLTSTPTTHSRASLPFAVAMLVPAAVLGALAVVGRGSFVFLASGAGVCAVAAIAVMKFNGGRAFSSALVCLPGAIGFVALWLAKPGQSDPFGHGAAGLLLLMPVALFAIYTLLATGDPDLRRACAVARQMAARTDLPLDLNACRQLPEVKRLRDALRTEAAPALALLNNEQAGVRLAALVALEHRRQWRVGEPNIV